jgi:ABC-type lipoprotein export system ATPase subunit
LDVELKGITKTYGKGDARLHALSCLNLRVRSGDMIAVSGPSGSGKSTLLYIIGLLERPSSGTVCYDGEDVSGRSDGARSRIRLHRIGFVFQQFYLLPNLNALENVMVPMREAGLGKAASRAKALELMERVGISRRANHLPGRMSGGEQQKVAIARALGNDPEIVLADEPTGELDAENTARIMDILCGLNRNEGRTVLVVSHDPEVTRRGRRVIRLKDGRLLSS